MKERILPWWFRKRDEESPEPVRSDELAVSSVNTKLLALLRKTMVPGVIASREDIGICSPKEYGDMVFGIFLYDIRESNDLRLNGMQAFDQNHLQFPPLYLELYYMMTAYSNIDIRYREEENHRMLTKAMQVMQDHPRLDGDSPLHAELLNLTLEEKMAIWNRFGDGYRLSVFYKISPVRLESTLRQEISRVQEIQVEAVPGRRREEGGRP